MHDTGLFIYLFYFIVDVLICFQAAVADLLTDLGSNVIINCDLDENYVYWILLKTADPPTVILQRFTIINHSERNIQCSLNIVWLLIM